MLLAWLLRPLLAVACGLFSPPSRIRPAHWPPAPKTWEPGLATTWQGCKRREWVKPRLSPRPVNLPPSYHLLSTFTDSFPDQRTGQSHSSPAASPTPPPNTHGSISALRRETSTPPGTCECFFSGRRAPATLPSLGCTRVGSRLPPALPRLVAAADSFSKLDARR